MTRMFANAGTLVRAEWPFKITRGLFLFAFFCSIYFALQRVTLLPVRALPLTPVDLAIGFDPRWVWIYQSAYLLMAGVPWLLDTRADLTRYLRGFILISLLGFACFLVMPVQGPRPDIGATTGMFAWLRSYDRPTNAFPSLHAGLLVYTILIATASSRHRVAPAPRWILLTLTCSWTVFTCYAAVATKQHYVVDIAAGALVGWLGYRWGWK